MMSVHVRQRTAGNAEVDRAPRDLRFAALAQRRGVARQPIHGGSCANELSARAGCKDSRVSDIRYNAVPRRRCRNPTNVFRSIGRLHGPRHGSRFSPQSPAVCRQATPDANANSAGDVAACIPNTAILGCLLSCVCQNAPHRPVGRLLRPPNRFVAALPQSVTRQWPLLAAGSLRSAELRLPSPPPPMRGQ